MNRQKAVNIERIPLAATAKAGILLVDDRPANLLALEAILDPLDQRLVRASSGEEALEKLAADDEFAVILMDVRMPGMDGLRTAEAISHRETAARVPIIFLTAVPIGNADVVSGYARGAVDFLLKPFDPEILRSKVSVFVDLYHKEQMIKRQAALLRQRDREAFERRSELRFRSLVDALPQCVWVARADQTFYYWNKRAADYIGIAAMAVSAERLFEFVHPDDVETIRSEWQLATGLHRSAEAQVRLRRDSDGAYRWFLVRAVPQHDESGKLTGWIVVATDIDPEHHALEEAEAASRMKEEFLATVSHELRNPLNAMVGWIHMLRAGTLDSAKTAKAVETIERNVNLQASLIDDILDVSRIIRGKINLEFETVRMGGVIEAALAAARPTADAKGVTLEYEPASETDEVRGDADRLQQIVWNLLSNAIKFTPRDGLAIVRLEQNENNLILTVRDTGQGISADFLPHVFDKFSQAEGGSTRSHGGLGLGLAIVRHLVELHAGTVSAASPGLGQGATFTVRLPISTSATATGDNDQLRTNSRAQKLEGVSILVVDDEQDSREVLAELLRQYGARTSTAASAHDALVEIDRAKPQVLLSDIGMPHVDGYELIRQVRKQIPETEMLALALTGLGSVHDKERALVEGFQQCIVKPVHPESLVETIEHLLGLRQQTVAHR